jgi:hypothetical protein
MYCYRRVARVIRSAGDHFISKAKPFSGTRRRSVAIGGERKIEVSFRPSGDEKYAGILVIPSDAHPDRVEVRGRDLTGDLMGRVTFTDYFYLLVTGREPTAEQRYFLDLLLVAIAEHGLVPTVQAARMTLAADPDSLQGAVADDEVRGCAHAGLPGGAVGWPSGTMEPRPTLRCQRPIDPVKSSSKNLPMFVMAPQMRSQSARTMSAEPSGSLTTE